MKNFLDIFCFLFCEVTARTNAAFRYQPAKKILYSLSLTLLAPIPDKEKKINLNFYFNTTFRNARGGKS